MNPKSFLTRPVGGSAERAAIQELAAAEAELAAAREKHAAHSALFERDLAEYVFLRRESDLIVFVMCVLAT